MNDNDTLLSQLLVKLEQVICAEQKALAAIEAIDEVVRVAPAWEITDYTEARAAAFKLMSAISNVKLEVLLDITTLHQPDTDTGVPF